MSETFSDIEILTKQNTRAMVYRAREIVGLSEDETVSDVELMIHLSDVLKKILSMINQVNPNYLSNSGQKSGLKIENISSLDSDIPFPEFSRYIVKYLISQILFKEGNALYAQAKAELDEMESEVRREIAFKQQSLLPFETDFSHYEEHR